jgi:hypothetical protein
LDWLNLGFNALWVLGCALALAAVSYASWQASLGEGKLVVQLGRRGVRLTLVLAAALVCSGLAGTASTSLETLFWALLTILWLVVAWLLRGD